MEVVSNSGTLASCCAGGIDDLSKAQFFVFDGACGWIGDVEQRDAHCRLSVLWFFIVRS
jgi:hypothetical protein